DLYHLSKEQLLSLDGFTDKSSQNLLDRIEASKETDLPRFLVALGVPHVGWSGATTLAEHFGSLEPLRRASVDELQAVGGIGPVVAEGVQAYFARPESNRLIDRLLAAGIRLASAERPQGRLSGKTFVLTGSLGSMTRPE